MEETAATIAGWLAAGQPVAVATVVQVLGSAPRPVGAKMAVAGDGRLAGSVSGGCVEGAVIQQAEAVLRDERPRRIRYGISDEIGWEVGLACGGIIEVLLHPAEPKVWLALQAAQCRGTRCALLTVVEPGSPHLGQQALMTEANAPAGLSIPPTAVVTRLEAAFPPWEAGTELLLEPFLPPPLLVIVGAVHTAGPLGRMAQMLGFRVVLVDPRRRFADQEHLAAADEILIEWPDAALDRLAVDDRSAIVILTHDPKIDEPALAAALRTEAFYVGAIGSRKTHAERFTRLAHLGEAALRQVYGPIGLDIGAQNPEEMALSILAEIVAVRHRRAGGFLRQDPA